MNERIRDLSEQAEKYADDNFRGEPTWSEAFESKFAQLIIEECMGHVTWVGRMNQWPIEPFLTALTINKRIKEQLGTS
jgi:hypothetical protein